MIKNITTALCVLFAAWQARDLQPELNSYAAKPNDDLYPCENQSCSCQTDSDCPAHFACEVNYKFCVYIYGGPG